MNRKSKAILVAMLAMTGATALLLSVVSKHQRISPPGVKVVKMQVLDEKGAVVAEEGVELPLVLGDFASEALPITKQELDMLPKDTTFGRRLYKEATGTNGMEIQVSVVLMGRDRSSIHRPDYCLPGQGWKVLSKNYEKIPIPQPQPYDLGVQKMTASHEVPLPDGGKGEIGGVYVYWFVTDQMVTASEKERFWLTTRELARKGTLKRWAYISCFAVCHRGDEQKTYERLKAFITQGVPHFHLAKDNQVAAK